MIRSDKITANLNILTLVFRNDTICCTETERNLLRVGGDKVNNFKLPSVEVLKYIIGFFFDRIDFEYTASLNNGKNTLSIRFNSK